MDPSDVENADPAGAFRGATSVSGPGGWPPAFDGLAAAVLDDRGTVVGWTGTAQDLTGRADPQLREELAGLGNAELFRTCAGLVDDSPNHKAGEGAVLHATHVTLGLLARRIKRLSEEVQELEGRLTRLVERHAPQLLEVVGIGPDAAVTLLITIGDNPERLGSEASFAALCGVSPVERSSGSRKYRRLNRGGDRQANAALHRIVQTRLRVDPRTQEYYERRNKEGKTRREIVRSLKRYAAREVFHLVRPVQPQPPP
ncbi:transposase [Streptomyces sp. NPDC001410]|uniref:transposase n=1 Tax=Streptomyces sp. NPDC001410 TaxID=3364574 RepID=UPI0036C4B3B1